MNSEWLYVTETLLVVQIHLRIYFLFFYDNHFLRQEWYVGSEALKYFQFLDDFCKVGFNSMQTFPLLI
jgi:hypothetical protein